MSLELEDEIEAFGYELPSGSTSGKSIPLTQPPLPPLRRVNPGLRRVWSQGIATNNGPIEGEFEQALQERFGWGRTLITANGTSALEILLRASLPPGEVIVPAFTFPAVAQAVASSGLIAVEADVESHSLTLNVESVARLITPQTVGVLAVHCFGLPADAAALLDLTRQHGLPLLFDGAPAVGVRLEDRPISDYGDGTVFSFHATKVFTTIEGGAIVTPHEQVHVRARRLRNFDLGNPAGCSPSGTNGKSNEVLSAIGLAGLPFVGANIEARALNHQRYMSRLDGVPGIRVLVARPGTIPNHASMAVRLRSRTGLATAERVAQDLQRHGISTRRYFDETYRVSGTVRRLPTPEADRAAEDVLCLPLWPELSPHDIDRICDVVLASIR